MKKTREKLVEEILDKEGQISRNFAAKYLSILRLAPRIFDLRQKGWDFTEKKVPNVKPDGSKGWDYVYVVKERPSPKPLSLGFN